jgi:hypothetical protein
LSREEERALRRVTDKDVVAVVDISGCCTGETRFTETIPNNYANVEVFAVRGSDVSGLQRNIGQGVVCSGYTADQIIDTPGCVQCIDAPKGLVSWWPADKHTNDIQGNNPGTLVLGTRGNVNPDAAFADGMVLEAFSLDGIDDFVRVGDVLDPGLSSITIDAWFKLTEEPSEFAIVQKGLYGIYGDSQDIWFTVSDGAREVSAMAKLPSLYEFHHVTAVLDRDKKVVKLYLDGIIADVEEYGALGIELGSIDNDKSFSIGGVDLPKPAKFFPGLIDEVEFFYRAVPGDEIRSVFASWRAGKCKGCVLPPDDMVSWWTGDRHARDIRDNNPGTLLLGNQGNTFVVNAYADGMVDRAFKLDGIDDFVQVVDRSNLDIASELTIDLWFNQDSSKDAYLVSKMDGRPGNYGLRVLGDGRIRFASFDTESRFVDSSAALQPKTWNHVAVTVNTRTREARFYLNGRLDAVRTWPYELRSNDAPLTIGFGEGTYFNGLIDEVELFDRELGEEEILSIFVANDKGKCKPYCEQKVRDYFVDELGVRLQQEAVKGSLSSELPHLEFATSIGRSIEVDMRNVAGSVSVVLKNPSGPVKVDNPEMRPISSFVVELDNYAVPATLDLKVPVPAGDLMADLYVALGDSWVQLESDRKDNKLVVKLKPADIEKYFVQRGSQRSAVFAVLSVSGHVSDQFVKLYDGGGNAAVIFVHGLTTNKVSLRKFIFEYEKTQDEVKVYAFFYSPTKSLDELAKLLAVQASSKLLQDGVSEVYIVPYSFGGIVTQEALKYAKQNNLVLADLTEKVVYLGTPFGGVPIFQVWDDFLSYLVNSPIASGQLKMHKSVFDALTKGRQESAPSVDAGYGLVLGTRGYPFTSKFFDKPNDGVVDIESAQPGWFVAERACDPNVLSVHLTHDQLPGAWPVREFVYQLTNKNRAVNGEAVLGYSQSVDVKHGNCRSGDRIVIVGELIPEEARPHACSCGDGVCGIGEDFRNCPVDCASVWQKFNVCLYLPWAADGLLLLLLIITAVYIYFKEKTHQRGKGFFVLFFALVITTVMVSVHYFNCRYLLPLAILLLLIIFAMLIISWIHFRKPKALKPIEQSLKRLEELFHKVK